MKKLILLTIVLFTMGCSDNEVTISKQEYDQLKGIKVDKPRTITFPEGSGPDYYTWTIHTASDGHDYLDNDGKHSYLLIHYIECSKCCKIDSIKEYENK